MTRLRETLIGRATDVGDVDRRLRAEAAAARLRVAVLVEGRSDAVAVEVVADRLGADLAAAGVCVVPMGGAMSVPRFARILGPAGLDVRILGLGDLAERAQFVQLLDDADVFVCVQDLEEELIRALGIEATERVLDAEGDLARFRTFQNQPAQRGREVIRQLHRFFGSVGGRKERYARALSAAIEPQRTPEPLAHLLRDALSAAEVNP